METHSFSFSLCWCCSISVSHRFSSSQDLFFVTATVQQQSHYIRLFPSSTAMDDASVFAIFPVVLGKMNGFAVQFIIGCCARDRTR